MVLSGEYYEVRMVAVSGLVVVRNIYGNSEADVIERARRIYAYLCIRSIEVGEIEDND